MSCRKCNLNWLNDAILLNCGLYFWRIPAIRSTIHVEMQQFSTIFKMLNSFTCLEKIWMNFYARATHHTWKITVFMIKRSFEDFWLPLKTVENQGRQNDILPGQGRQNDILPGRQLQSAFHKNSGHPVQDMYINPELDVEETFAYKSKKNYSCQCCHIKRSWEMVVSIMRNNSRKFRLDVNVYKTSACIRCAKKYRMITC